MTALPRKSISFIGPKRQTWYQRLILLISVQSAQLRTLRAMCLAMHEELKKQNVFLGTVTVTGTIAPGEACDPALLAEDFWKLYTDRSDCEIVH